MINEIADPRSVALSRRTMLAGLCATGACALPLVSAAQPPPSRIIDVHHHLMTDDFLRGQDVALRRIGGSLIHDWTPERSIDEMDRNGVGMAVLSISTPGSWTGDVAASRKLARSINESAAKIAATHKGRFGFFATLPLMDTQGSLREIEYALDTLGAQGVCILSSYGDFWPGDRRFRPVFEEMNRRKGIVYCHPTAPLCCGSPGATVPAGEQKYLQPGISAGTLEFGFDTTRAIFSFLYGGTFRHLDRVRFVFSHGGGTLPMIVGRLSVTSTRRYLPWDGQTVGDLMAPAEALAQIGRLRFDTASVANKGAFAALSAMVPASNILFGSDFPYVPIGDTLSGLAGLGLARAEQRAILGENAAQLLGIHQT